MAISPNEHIKKVVLQHLNLHPDILQAYTSLVNLTHKNAGEFKEPLTVAISVFTQAQALGILVYYDLETDSESRKIAEEELVSILDEQIKSNYGHP